MSLSGGLGTELLGETRKDERKRGNRGEEGDLPVML